MTWNGTATSTRCRNGAASPAGPTRNSPSCVHDDIAPENIHTTITYLCSRGKGHVTKDAVVVAPGLAHGRARGLQAYLLPAVTIPRARRPHRPPTLSLSHTPFKRRRSAGDAKDRRPRGLSRLPVRPCTASPEGCGPRGLSRLPARPYTAVPKGPRPPSMAAGVYHGPPHLCKRRLLSSGSRGPLGPPPCREGRPLQKCSSALGGRRGRHEVRPKWPLNSGNSLPLTRRGQR